MKNEIFVILAFLLAVVFVPLITFFIAYSLNNLINNQGRTRPTILSTTMIATKPPDLSSNTNQPDTDN